MAIFIGYLLNAILFAPIVLYYYFVGRLNVIVIPLIIAILVLAPLTFRYSRVVWLYLDEALDPRHLHEEDVAYGETEVASDGGQPERQDAVGVKEA